MTSQLLESVQVKILDQRVGSKWPMPQYQTNGSAAMDLLACIDAPLELSPKSCQLVATGISIYIRDAKFCAKILPRSGLGHKHGVVLGNGTGLIDADYQGPLMVSCLNRSDSTYIIQPGERIAQLIFLPVVRPQLNIVTAFDGSETERGAGGFGSTGR